MTSYRFRQSSSRKIRLERRWKRKTTWTSGWRDTGGGVLDSASRRGYRACGNVAADNLDSGTNGSGWASRNVCRNSRGCDFKTGRKFFYAADIPGGLSRGLLRAAKLVVTSGGARRTDPAKEQRRELRSQLVRV